MRGRPRDVCVVFLSRVRFLSLFKDLLVPDASRTAPPSRATDPDGSAGASGPVRSCHGLGSVSLQHRVTGTCAPHHAQKSPKNFFSFSSLVGLQ